MTTKRKGILLVLLYVFLFSLALPLHLQKGIEWNNSFYRQTQENTFKANKNNGFSYVQNGSEIDFDLLIDGKSYRAKMTQGDNATYRFAFDDGMSLILTGSSFGGISVGDRFIPLGNSGSVTLIDDLSSTPLVFSPYVIEKTPFYDGETGKKEIGEWIVYQTTDGKHIYGYEVWHDGSYSSSPPTFVTLKDGAVIEQLQSYNSSILYVNESNEILTNPACLTYFPGEEDMDQTSRYTTCWLLINAAVQDDTHYRGHAVVFFTSLLYFLGLAQYLWPEQMAFFGSRWQYRYEPELSDSGLVMAKFSGILIMVIFAGILFLPLFIY